MIQSLLPWLGVIGVILAVILFIYCIALQMKINNLTKKYDFFMADEKGQSLERKLSVEVKELRDATASVEKLFHEQEAIKKTQLATLQKIGFVKYNAFENIGNDLSFALTLLDGNTNGVIISSIYGRNESRVFSKPVVKGKCVASLSQEELESLNEALSDTSNEESLVSASVNK